MKHILILEDDYTYRKVLVEKLQKYGRVFEADNLEKALKIYGAGHIDFAFVDLDLEKKLDGLLFLEKTQGLNSIVLSSHDEEDVIAQAFKLGAIQFLNKWNFDKHLEVIIDEQLTSKTLDVESIYETKNKNLSNNIARALNLFGNTNQSLLITGETGVGKGKLAKSLSNGSAFIHANLSEFGAGTIESELFGHVKGSFTGATQDKIGLLKKADGGILFLDEIGTLSIELQKKLLRVIEEQAFYPVGSNQASRSKFRLVTATCDDLEMMIKDKSFREDFYFRISGIKLELTPLRERIEDIELTIKSFNKNSPKKIFFSKTSKELILHNDWNGNYRELLAFLEKVRALSRGMVEPRLINELIEKESSYKEDFFSKEMKRFIEKKGLRSLLNEIEKSALDWALDKQSGKLNEAIRLLDVSKSLFYRIQGQVNNAS